MCVALGGLRLLSVCVCLMCWILSCGDRVCVCVHVFRDDGGVCVCVPGFCVLNSVFRAVHVCIYLCIARSLLECVCVCVCV